MSSKTLPSLTDENRDLHKHIGCMNGIFQLFDRHYFLTSRRSTRHNHKRLLSGANNDRETKSATEKATARLHLQGKNLEVEQDQTRISTESLGTSFSSSSGSSTFSSLDHGKAVQCRPPSFNHNSFLESPSQIPVKQRSLSLHVSQQSPDLRDVVKDSMQREQRSILVKTATKEGGRGRTMKHVDSPRPIQHLKTGEPRVADIDRANHILAKLQEFSQNSKEDRDASLRKVRNPPRFSYDGRETRETFKATAKLKELPRLSLDSRESTLRSSSSESRLNFLLRELQRGNGTVSQIVNGNQEPGSNKRPSNVVVKLMGLEAFPESVAHDQEETMKVNKNLDQDFATRSLKKTEKSKKNSAVFQQNVHKDPNSPRSKNASLGMKPTSSSRFPLEIAPWRQSDAIQAPPRTTPNMWNGCRNATPTSSSVYGEIEKRISELEFKKSGKDLRALKQILGAMQNTRTRLENQEGEQTDLKTQTSRFSSDYSSCNHEGSKASDWQRSQANQLAPIKSSSSPKRFNSSVLITKSARLMDNSRISSASMVPSADASHLQQLRTHNIPYTREDLLDKPVTKDQTPHKYSSPNPNKCKPPIDKITNVNTSKAVHTTRGPQLGKVDKYTAFGRSSGSVSPRFQQKNHEIEQESCLTTPSTDFGKVRRKLSRQSTEQDSSKRKPRQKSTLRQTKDKLCSATYSRNFIHQSDTASIQSESNSSLASLTETEVTSTESSIEIKTKQQVDQNERNGSARLDDDLPLAQLAIVPTEQPSPISVLDATFYREDSPSPVKKISTIFQDYETSSPDEAEWHYLEDEFNQKKLENINHLVTKLRLLNTMPDEDSMHQVASICKSPSPDHKYITKVLLASGLLKDKGPISTAIQVQSPGHLINPDLFHVLEQTEQSTKLASEEQKQRTVPLKRDQKIHRKIVFDTVNEILVRKLAAEGPFLPRKRTKTGKELLRELYSEVDRLQANTDCSLDDADGSISILNADMMQQPDDWVDYQSELPAMVLDIERLIFKDLITEVITADAVGLCDWPRRQCMKVLNKQ